MLVDMETGCLLLQPFSHGWKIDLGTTGLLTHLCCYPDPFLTQNFSLAFCIDLPIREIDGQPKGEEAKEKTAFFL